MNTTSTSSRSTASVMQQQTELTLLEVSRCCAVQIDFVTQMIDEGMIAPLTGSEPANWRFADSQLRQITRAWRLQRDLGINLAGAALALQLLDEIETLRAQIAASA